TSRFHDRSSRSDVRLSAVTRLGAIPSTIVRVAAMPGFDTVSFLSDYGLADEFVGLVKAVIRALAPHVTVIEPTHAIPPRAARAAPARARSRARRPVSCLRWWTREWGRPGGRSP